MTLTPTGVEFITKGYASFVAQMAGAVEAVSSIGRMTQNRLAAIDKFNAVLGKVSNTVSAMARASISTDRVTVALEKTKQAAEKTAQAMQRTTQENLKMQQASQRTAQALERTKQVTERTTQAFERTKQSQERTVQALERTKQAADRTVQAFERTKQSQERTTQALEKTKQSWAVYRQEQERSKQAAMHMVNALAHVATAFLTKRNAVTSATSALSGARTVVGNFTASLGNLTKSVFFGNALWDIAKSGLTSVINKMREWAKTAWDAAASLQTVTIRLENMIARQIRAAGVTDDLTTSLQMAGKATQETLDWIAELAMSTMFGADMIAETLAFATAMGWTTEEAKDLTSAIVDYSAAMGLTNQNMDRIIFNFAQMKAAGKVTATEMRDLARGAFFPLTDILDIAAENLGIAADGLIEFRQAASEGQIDVEAFFDAFLQYVKRDFPNAARNMNNTMSAVIDNFKDFLKTAIGWKMLAPTINLVSDRLAAFLEKLTSNKALVSFERIGLGMAYAMEKVFAAVDKVTAAISDLFRALGFTMPTVRQITQAFVAFGVIIEALGNLLSNFINGTLIPFVNGIQDKMGGSFKDMASEAFQWGGDIIVNFANGIIQTAATVIATAMRYLQSILTGWLESHSPPDILPDLPEWGASAMAEYLRGFTMADFSMLDSVQGLMKGALDALVDLGALGEVAGAEMFLGISEGLIQAIDQLNETGEIGAEIFEQLRSIGGGLGDELATLLNRQVDLTNATEKLAEAQEAYNAAVEATKNAQGKVNTAIRQYNKMLRDGASEADLAAQLAIVNAEEQGLANAVDQQVAAKENVEMWEAAIKPLEQAVKLQEKLIQQLLELMKAQADLEEARRRAAAGGGGDGGGDDGGGIVLPPFNTGGIGGDLEGWFDTIKQEMIDKLGGIWETITGMWETGAGDAFGTVRAAWDGFWAQLEPIIAYWGQLLGSIWTNLKTYWEDYGAATFVEFAGQIAIAIGNVILLGMAIGTWILEKIDDITAWLVENGPLIDEFVGVIGEIIVRLTEFANKVWERDLKPALDEMIELFEDVGVEIMKIATSDWFQDIIDTVFEVGDSFSKNIGGIALKVIQWLRERVASLGAWFKTNGPTIAKAVDNIGRAFRLLGDIANKDVVPNLLMGLSGTGDLVGGLGTIALDMVAGDWSKAWSDAKATLVNFLDYMLANPLMPTSWFANIMGMEIVPSAIIEDAFNDWEEIKTIVGTAADELWVKVQTIWTDIQTWIGTTIDSIKTKIDTVTGEIKLAWDTFWDGVNQKVTDIWLAIQTWISDKIDAIEEKMGITFEEIRDRVQAIWDRILLIIETVWGKIVGWVTEKVEAVEKVINDKIENIKTNWGIAWNWVQNLITTVWGAIVGWVTEKIAAVQGIIDGKVTEIKTGWGIAWDWVKQKVDEIWDAIVLAITGIAPTVLSAALAPIEDAIVQLGLKVTDFYDAGVDLLAGMTDGVLAEAGNLIDTVLGAIEDALGEVERLLGIQSPSTVFASLGENMMKGMAEGISDSASLAEQAMIDATNELTPQDWGQVGTMRDWGQVGTLAAPPVSTGSGAVTITFGDTIISSNMDAAEFRSSVIRVIRESL